MEINVAMKAILVPAPGGPDSLVFGEAPVPKTRPGEVLVRVRATAVNRADLLQAAGSYPPPPGESPILGLEAAGEIEETGERVFCLLPGGGYAERVAVPRGMLMPIPEGLSFVEAAAIPEAWFTAFLNLWIEAGYVSPERVLVHAAASGVGTAAIQLVRRAGGRVAATVRSATKVGALERLGASPVIDTSKEDFERALENASGFGREGIDVILDPIGASMLGGNLRVLARGGRLVLIATPTRLCS